MGTIYQMNFGHIVLTEEKVNPDYVTESFLLSEEKGSVLWQAHNKELLKKGIDLGMTQVLVRGDSNSPYFMNGGWKLVNKDGYFLEPRLSAEEQAWLNSWSWFGDRD